MEAGMKDNKGFALVATLLVMVLITVVVGAAVTGAAAAVRSANLDYRNSRTFYAAEAGAEAVMAQLHDALEDGTLDDEELAAVTAPTIPGFTYTQFNVQKVGGIVIERITDGAFAGLYSLTQRIDIHSEVSDESYNTSGIIVSAKAQAIPIFQFGVFYEQDLEITNGPPMEFAGWVHSNGNIYMSSANAWYRDVITTPSLAIHDRKDENNVLNGVFINDASGNEVQLDFDSRTVPDPATFRAQSDAKFDNRLKTNAYGVDTLRVPLPTGMPPIVVMLPRQAGDVEVVKQAKFAWKADWYVEVDLSSINNMGTDLCGAMVSTRDGGQTLPSNAECGNIFTWTWEAFYEGRENRKADVLDINLAQLFAWTGTDASRVTRIFYVTFRGGGGFDPSGDGVYPVVRLRNGQQLGNPFTVATDHPYYVQGDFNTINWKPASVVGDAVVLLSNAWVDSGHTGPGLTAASSTTYNFAVLAGHSATACDWFVCGTNPYGGGLENYPRFLENWNGRTATYRGSLVSLSTSVKATAPWSYGVYYTAPTRDWMFDTRFEDPANLPPGTPVVGNVIHTAFRPAY
jgi:type II secretory pathway pseudopilin PulG